MTQREAAALMGVTANTWARWERGMQIHPARVAQLESLCRKVRALREEIESNQVGFYDMAAHMAALKAAVLAQEKFRSELGLRRNLPVSSGVVGQTIQALRIPSIPPFPRPWLR